MATKAYTVDAIERRLKRMAGLTAVSADDTAAVIEAINDALLDIHIKGGPRGFRYAWEDETASCTSGTGYITLGTDVGIILKETVRTTGNGVRLTWVPNWGDMLDMDAKRTATGEPRFFTILGDGGTSPDGDQRRMYFKPIPDSAYTIGYTHIRIPAAVSDGANAIAEMPDAYHRVVFYAAAMILWEDLGQPDHASYYRGLYRERMRDMFRMETSDPTPARLATPAPTAGYSEYVTDD